MVLATPPGGVGHGGEGTATPGSGRMAGAEPARTDPEEAAVARTIVDDDIAVVREFLDALARFDMDRVEALLDPDATYQNVPFPPARGRSAVMEQLRGFARWGSGFEVVHHNIAAADGTVLTERTDVLAVGAVRARFWVCGTFEVRDGRIVLWRDRFDFVNLTWGFVRGGAKALLGRVRGA